MELKFYVFALAILLFQCGLVDCRGAGRGRSHSSGPKRHLKVEIDSDSNSSDSEDNKLIGIIIGSSIGGLLALTLTVFLAYYFCSSKKSSKQITNSANEMPMPPT